MVRPRQREDRLRLARRPGAADEDNAALRVHALRRREGRVEQRDGRGHGRAQPEVRHRLGCSRGRPVPRRDHRLARGRNRPLWQPVQRRGVGRDQARDPPFVVERRGHDKPDAQGDVLARHGPDGRQALASRRHRLRSERDRARRDEGNGREHGRDDEQAPVRLHDDLQRERDRRGPCASPRHPRLHDALDALCAARPRAGRALAELRRLHGRLGERDVQDHRHADERRHVVLRRRQQGSLEALHLQREIVQRGRAFEG